MTPCPAWEYTAVAGHQRVLSEHYLETLKFLKQNAGDSQDDCLDTTDLHGAYFKDLVPNGFEYYAGNYRGSRFKCLRNRGVKVEADPRVGTAPREVASAMAGLARQIETAIDKLDRLRGPKEEHLLETITTVCEVHVAFLTVHPYLNGNGHMARFILVALLGRYGYWPARFPIEPKPSGPYYETLNPYRDGNAEPLLEFVLDCFEAPLAPENSAGSPESPPR